MKRNSTAKTRLFGHMYQEHGSRIYGIGLRMCRRPEDAEDLVQETFLAAYRDWEQFQGRSQVSTWLYTIASRLCLRRHRRRAGEPRQMEPLQFLIPTSNDNVPDIAAPGKGPLDRLLEVEMVDAVEQAIAGLPRTFRLPCLLKDVAGLSISQIAEILGLKKATVKTRVHRARLVVRKELARRVPTRVAVLPEHSHRTCWDLIQAKQEAMDRGVSFPLDADLLCVHCYSIMLTLDWSREILANLGGGEVPAEILSRLFSEFQRSKEGREAE